MRHPTTEHLMAADDSVIHHLETCRRCRLSLPTDVDLDRAWRGIVAGMDRSPMGAYPSPVRRGWRVGAVAAVAVTLLLLPAGLYLLTGAENGDVASGPNSEPDIVQAPVVSPEAPPAPVDEGAAALPAPPDSPAYEMTFSVGDEIRGRLIWARPDYFESVRVTIDPQTGPEFDYKLFRTGDGTGYGDPDDSSLEWTFPDGQTLADSLETFSTPHVPDPDIPWDLLVAGDLAAALEVLELTAADEVEPSHPLADQAWETNDVRLEATEDGIPVLVDRGDGPAFTVDHLERRVLFQGEVGNNADIPIEYALYRAPLTTPEQRPVLADGIVTFADYRAAAEAAADCAGIDPPELDDETKLFPFPESAANCVSTWMSDIEMVWRLDAQLVDDDEMVIRYYEARGETDAAEVFRSEQGPERPLASADGWAIAISRRGPGYCTRTSVSADGTYGEGCFAVSQMHIPGVLSLDGGASYTDGKIDRGRMLGIVHQDAVQIEVTFSSGTTETIVPGNVVEFGYRGFGYLYDAARLGVPVRYEIHGLAGLPSTYDTGFCDEEHAFALPEADRAEVCS